MEGALCCTPAPWVEGTMQRLNNNTIKIGQKGGQYWFADRVKSSDCNTDRKFRKFFPCCMCQHQGAAEGPAKSTK